MRARFPSPTIFLALILLLSCAASAAASVFTAVGGQNLSFDSRIASFGPRLPEDGVTGRLVPIGALGGDPFGCVAPNASEHAAWAGNGTAPGILIALVQRGKCPFLDKFIAMQAAGFAGLVVGDDRREPLVTMYAESDTDGITVPGVFVGLESYEMLRDLAANCSDKEDGLEVTLFPSEPPFQLIPLLLASLGLPLFTLGSLIALNHLRRARTQSRVAKLPIIKYARKSAPSPAPPPASDEEQPLLSREQDDDDEEVCAICLDEFHAGDSVRMLGCGHGYHPDCIDPWLKQRAVCPVCKRVPISLALAEEPEDGQPIYARWLYALADCCFPRVVEDVEVGLNEADPLPGAVPNIAVPISPPNPDSDVGPDHGHGHGHAHGDGQADSGHADAGFGDGVGDGAGDGGGAVS